MTFGFKSKQQPAQINQMESFEKDSLDMIKAIKFRNMKEDFQAKVKSNISKKKKNCPQVYLLGRKDNRAVRKAG